MVTFIKCFNTFIILIQKDQQDHQEQDQQDQQQQEQHQQQNFINDDGKS